jgi:hypothetical protein
VAAVHTGAGGIQELIAIAVVRLPAFVKPRTVHQKERIKFLQGIFILK